jgi:hypothetical protein
MILADLPVFAFSSVSCSWTTLPHRQRLSQIHHHSFWRSQGDARILLLILVRGAALQITLNG